MVYCQKIKGALSAEKKKRKEEEKEGKKKKSCMMSQTCPTCVTCGTADVHVVEGKSVGFRKRKIRVQFSTSLVDGRHGACVLVLSEYFFKHYINLMFEE